MGCLESVWPTVWVGLHAFRPSLSLRAPCCLSVGLGLEQQHLGTGGSRELRILQLILGTGGGRELRILQQRLGCLPSGLCSAYLPASVQPSMTPRLPLKDRRRLNLYVYRLQ